jgi:hypothetical protein
VCPQPPRPFCRNYFNKSAGVGRRNPEASEAAEPGMSTLESR